MSSLTNLVAIVSAIYLIEGGENASTPYGIKSIKVSSREEAKYICENTVRNNWARWNKAGRPGCFYSYLAKIYVGTNDPKGIRNWDRNIKLKLKHKPCNCR